MDSYSGLFGSPDLNRPLELEEIFDINRFYGESSQDAASEGQQHNLDLLQNRDYNIDQHLAAGVAYADGTEAWVPPPLVQDYTHQHMEQRHTPPTATVNATAAIPTAPDHNSYHTAPNASEPCQNVPGWGFNSHIGPYDGSNPLPPEPFSAEETYGYYDHLRQHQHYTGAQQQTGRPPVTSVASCPFQESYNYCIPFIFYPGYHRCCCAVQPRCLRNKNPLTSGMSRETTSPHVQTPFVNAHNGVHHRFGQPYCQSAMTAEVMGGAPHSLMARSVAEPAPQASLPSIGRTAASGLYYQDPPSVCVHNIGRSNGPTYSTKAIQTESIETSRTDVWNTHIRARF
ncbi:uncharacterized protein LAESUDRAFT_812564 [Laetiporus sulphureus 93-53]|uniref:Uncharacterized protein n=1 Tax=Laetiporus sulphureus 93-53 TaxID=1314785 RepID=A0A165EEW9_9APHY|nr:uncharacterized protein LAESUDRAFT_812564 [Laetiporus sulphureus 93-53]KZT06905.1 hypothetical protein LAESUDRAFT_812564 [Laetiporus sulphureus 93-53]